MNITVNKNSITINMDYNEAVEVIGSLEMAENEGCEPTSFKSMLEAAIIERVKKW